MAVEGKGRVETGKEKGELQDFRRLQVWEKSHRLVLAVYQATAGFPPAERYGLTSQIRRASVEN